MIRNDKKKKTYSNGDYFTVACYKKYKCRFKKNIGAVTPDYPSRATIQTM